MIRLVGGTMRGADMKKRIKEFRYGIKLMKWSRSYRGDPAWIFAKAWTFRGYLILRFRGYKPHMTIFGKVLRKDIVT